MLTILDFLSSSFLCMVKSVKFSKLKDMEFETSVNQSSSIQIATKTLRSWHAFWVKLNLYLNCYNQNYMKTKDTKYPSWGHHEMDKNGKQSEQLFR